MKKRIITAIVGIGLMVPVCWFSDTWAYPILFAALSAVAVFEMLRCVGSIRKWWLSVPALVIGLAAPLAARLLADRELFLVILGSTAFFYLLYAFCLAVFSQGNYTVEQGSITFATVFYVAVAFSCLVLLRDTENGKYLYLLAFIGPWVSDVFAFFCGRAFGKHKLIPRISPHKTVEGSLGGLILTPVFVVIYGVLISRFLDSSLTPNYLGLVIVGIVLSLSGQLGDLIASAIKRQYGIKDYGKIFPGHGGVLDRFDSILTAAPLLLLLSMLPDFLNIFR